MDLLITRIDILDEKIERLNESIEKLTVTCQHMDDHIVFVERTYNAFEKPLYWMKNKIDYYLKRKSCDMIKDSDKTDYTGSIEV